MKVKVIKSSLSSYWYADKIGEVFEVRDTQEHLTDYLVNNDSEYFGWGLVKTDVEIINEEKQMKKSDLKTGMRVVTADGWSGICLNLEGKNVIVSAQDYLFIDGMRDDLTCEGASGCNVVKVYGPPASYLHMINPCVKGDLLWKRNDKTEEQKQLDIVVNQIKELQKQAENLQGMINK